MKVLAFALLLGAVGVHDAASADEFTPSGLVRVDWQGPQQLPPQWRNHCDVDRWSGRPYCADHCGIGYQFYYCSEGSFGCCHLGRGYCDRNGLLRCHP